MYYVNESTKEKKLTKNQKKLFHLKFFANKDNGRTTLKNNEKVYYINGGTQV